MSSFKTKNITLMEEVETNEAEEIIELYRKKYKYFVLVPLLCFFISFVIMIANGQDIGNISSDTNTVLVVLPGVSFVLTVLGLIIYVAKMRPYLKLLKLAELNDRVRHEERIRFKERKRLESEMKTEFQTEDIEKTLTYVVKDEK